MDPQSGLCRGCFRTMAEIARWAGMSEAERKRVLCDLPARKPQEAPQA